VQQPEKDFEITVLRAAKIISPALQQMASGAVRD
jgi:hypothetical protein